MGYGQKFPGYLGVYGLWMFWVINIQTTGNRGLTRNYMGVLDESIKGQAFEGWYRVESIG